MLSGGGVSFRTKPGIHVPYRTGSQVDRIISQVNSRKRLSHPNLKTNAFLT